MKIVFTPNWFTGSDIAIDFVSFLVLAAFFIFSYRSYKLSKNKNSLHLGYGFLLIAFAELSNIFTKLVLFYDTSFTRQIGQMIITYHVVHSVDIFYDLGFFCYKLLTLLGLYVIFRILDKRKTTNVDNFLMVYFIVVISILGSIFNYVFNLTALAFLVVITLDYIGVYKKNKSENTKMLIAAFGLLGLSQLIFLLSSMPSFYVLGQILQLVSYLILLFLIIRIVYYGKKKK